MNRIEKWRDSRYFPRAFIGEYDDETLKTLIESKPIKKNAGDIPSTKGFSLDEIIFMCKEVIFDFSDGSMKLFYIVYGIDPQCLQICVTHLLESVEATSNDVKQTLALAQIYEIPVIPNNEASTEKLLNLYSELYEDGWEVELEGKKQHIRLTEKTGAPQFGLNDQRFLTSIDLRTLTPPVVALAARRMAEKRDADFKLARRFLDEIETGISRLRETLDNDHRESDLQVCLQNNPILFGTEYREVIPKLSLGSEFEMDFALKTWNGEIHILEIEDSRRPLFNKKLRPSSFLVHAEQQVLDWYSWIENYPSYAESRLINLARPYGFVIIGRGKQSEAAAKTSRNRIFKGRFEILTYDDLLRKAEALKEKVTGKL